MQMQPRWCAHTSCGCKATHRHTAGTPRSRTGVQHLKSHTAHRTHKSRQLALLQQPQARCKPAGCTCLQPLPLSPADTSVAPATLSSLSTLAATCTHERCAAADRHTLPGQFMPGRRPVPPFLPPKRTDTASQEDRQDRRPHICGGQQELAGWQGVHRHQAASRSTTHTSAL